MTPRQCEIAAESYTACLLAQAGYDVLALHHAAAILQHDFGTHKRTDTVLPRGQMRANRRIDAVALAQRQRRHLQTRAGLDNAFRIRCPAKKTECRTGVKLDVDGHEVRIFEMSELG